MGYKTHGSDCQSRPPAKTRRWTILVCCCLRGPCYTCRHAGYFSGGCWVPEFDMALYLEDIVVSTIHWPNVGSMLCHRLRHWPNIEPALGQCIVFAGMVVSPPTTRSTPANTRRSPIAGLMLIHRRRRWTNIKPALPHCLGTPSHTWQSVCTYNYIWHKGGWKLGQHLQH